MVKDMKDQRIYDRVSEKHEIVKMQANQNNGYQFVLMTTLVGSQNYGLEFENSDVDTYSLVLPSFLDFVTGKPPVSKEINFPDGSKACIKDLRSAFQLLRKTSPNSIEWFLSDYKIYESAFTSVFEKFLSSETSLYYLTHADIHNMINATIGCICGLHGRNMSEGKKLSHAIRLSNTLFKYLDSKNNPTNYLLLDGNELQQARSAKAGLLKDPQIYLQQLKDKVETFSHQYILTEQAVTTETIAKTTIDRFETKLFDIYLNQNGYRSVYNCLN